MQSINVSTFKSNGVNSPFNSITTIDITDIPFDNGNFGEVYYCDALNGRSIEQRLVIKVFIDDGTGSAQRGYKTITRLLEQMISHNDHLGRKKEKLIQEVNALAALPLFSFEGTLNDRPVYGYAATCLSAPDWMLFSKIFQETDLEKRKALRNAFYQLPLQYRLQMAFDLVEGFYHLEQMKFIYADLNQQNIFVNMGTGNLALIDYEGGAINDHPETYGKPGEWLAPEIMQQLTVGGSEIIKVDLNTDTWAVCIAVHFMLFNFHPIFFLTTRGEEEMKRYLEKNKWPEADLRDDNFRTEVENIYHGYIDKLKQNIHPSLVNAFAETINFGYFNSARRISYQQWKTILKGLMQPPVIEEFKPDRIVSIAGAGVVLKWKVENNESLYIDNGIGEVTGLSQVKVNPEKHTTYTLKASGRFGDTERSTEVAVFPIPAMEGIKIPLAEFEQGLQIPDIIVKPPEINAAIRLDASRFSELPDLVDLQSEFQQIKPLHKMGGGLWSVSHVYEKLKDRINKLMTILC